MTNPRNVLMVLTALVAGLLTLWLFSLHTKDRAPAPTPSAASEAAELESRREWNRRKALAIQWCEHEENGTAVMGFGFQVICVDPDVPTITYDVDTDTWLRRGGGGKPYSVKGNHRAIPGWQEQVAP
jgi:hypothetical protein